MAFLVFAFDTRWPDGGWRDLYGMAATALEAQALVDKAVVELAGDEIQMVDQDTGKIVMELRNATRDRKGETTKGARG